MNDFSISRNNLFNVLIPSVYFTFLFLLPSVSKIAFIVLLIYAVFSGQWKNYFRLLRTDKILWIFLAYFIMHIAGLLYSENIRYGLNDIVTKLSFLLMPFLFASLSLTADNWEKIKRSFVVASFVSIIVLFLISLYRFSFTGDRMEFFYINLSHGGHVTYQAIYLTLALLMIEERIFTGKGKRSVNLLMFAVIFAGICMLSARTSTTVAIAAIILFPVLISRKRTFTIYLYPYLFILIFLQVVFFSYLHFYNRFQQVENEIVIRQQKPETVQKEEPNSTNIRINIWSNAIQLIKRNLLFGVGTGDIKEELVKVYTENHYEYGIRERISPHNQFLHTGVILGISGVSILLLQLTAPAVLAFRQREWLYFFFLLIIFLNCLTESMLEREAGILFFTAFNSCLYLRMREKMYTPS